MTGLVTSDASPDFLEFVGNRFADAANSASCPVRFERPRGAGPDQARFLTIQEKQIYLGKYLLSSIVEFFKALGVLVKCLDA